MDDNARQVIGSTAPSITSRIDAITLIPEEYRAITPPCPRSAKIELTARCNYGVVTLENLVDNIPRGDAAEGRRDREIPRVSRRKA